MSRALILNSLNKLSDLLDHEEGKGMIGGGRGRKKIPGYGYGQSYTYGGAMIPYGSGLEASPASFGHGRGCYGGRCNIPGTRCTNWNDFIKRTYLENDGAFSIPELASDPNIRAAYYAQQGIGQEEQEKLAIKREKAAKKAAEQRAYRADLKRRNIPYEKNVIHHMPGYVTKAQMKKLGYGARVMG